MRILFSRTLRALPILALAAAGRADEAKLSIERALAHQSDDGPPVPESFPFSPADTVYFSCQLAGYHKTEKEYGKWEVYLTYSVEARDADGVLLTTPEEGKIATAVTAEDKNWMPKVRFSFQVPPFAASGRYRINVKAKDESSGGEAQAAAFFTVEGRDVPPSAALVVRNFRFLRSEEDQDPLQTPAYRPGDMVWARFDIAGYKLGEKNGFDVEYGLKVLRPGGEITYALPKAAEEKSDSFYPRRYTPGVLSLVLPKDLKRGEYTVALAVRDNLGNQSFEILEKFQVE